MLMHVLNFSPFHLSSIFHRSTHTNTHTKKTDDDSKYSTMRSSMGAMATHRDICPLPTVVLLYSPLANSGLSISWKTLLLLNGMTVNINMYRTARWLARNIGTCTMSGKRNSSKKLWTAWTHWTSFCCLTSYRSFAYTVARKCKNIADCCSYLSNKWHAIWAVKSYGHVLISDWK